MRDEDRARRAAYDVVFAVDRDGAYANLLLPRLLRERGLTTTDAAFATEVAYGTLRWQGVLDEVVAAAARRPVAAMDAEVRAVLRIGAYQLLQMRVPPHAAVHSTVEVARRVAGHRVVGFVNAVLRAVGRRSWDGWVNELAPSDELGRLAFETGYPRWIATALLDALDADMPELRAALAMDRPTTHLVARPGRISRDELLAEAGAEATPGPWSPYAVRLSGGGDPARLAAVRDGRAAVQDEGSQCVAIALAKADVAGDETWWADVCAGPGGKAALLAGLARPGIRLLAVDRQPHRAQLVAGSVRDNGDAFVLVGDSTCPAWRADAFDRVLVDAPCTGLGALRRRPDVRWRRHAEDVGPLHELQAELLTQAVESTRPGGVIAYVTCSPHPHETRDVVRRVAAAVDVTVEDARQLLPGVPELGAGPDVQLWPHRHGTDAMYLAVLRRNSGSGH